MPPNDKLLRWIDLLCALLRRTYGATFAELRQEVPAYAMAASESAMMRAFERDKDELRKAGIAIESHRSDDGEADTYRLPSTTFYLPYLVLTDAARPGPELTAAIRRPTSGFGYQRLPVLALTPEEAVMLRRAAARLQMLGEPRLNDDASQAFRKLRHDLPEAFPPPAIDASSNNGDGGVSDRFAMLAEAVQRHKRVTITYHSIGSGKTSPRAVEPLGLVYLTGHWYLVARDAANGAPRHFRTSRITAVEINSAQPNSADFALPDGFDLRTHARSRHAWELGDADAEVVDVHFHMSGAPMNETAVHTTGQSAPADSVATDRIRFGEAVPTDTTGATPDPALRRFRVRRRDVFLRWLLSFAGDASPVAPPAVVDDWRTLLAATRAAHGAAAAPGTTAAPATPNAPEPSA